MPILGVPLALIGLAALPALTAIYWLRTRFRRQEVSSLFLWSLVAQAHGGGRRATRLQTPLLWLLELLALLLLAFAAAGPRVPRADRVVPVVVVLDDSFSMSAVQDDGYTVRDAGVDVITRELGRLGPFTARFVVAGPTPALQDGAVSRLADLESAIVDWRCESTSSSIGPAVALAREVGGPDCRVLVISDHPSPDAPSSDEDAGTEAVVSAASGTADQAGRLRWRAVGRSQPNAAIVNAVRSTDPKRDQVLIEVANYSDKPYNATLTLLAANDNDSAGLQTDAVLGTSRVIDQRTLELAPNETRRLRLVPPKKDETLIAQLDEDALAADNRAVLLPPAREPLPVAVSIQDAVLAKAVRSAVQASGVATLESTRPRLTFTDRMRQGSSSPTTSDAVSAQPVTTDSISDPPATSTTWRVEFEVPEAEAIDAYLGPFVIDYNHPLASGLSLTGLVWAAPTVEAGLPVLGRPVVSAGDVSLITERDLAGDAKSLRIRLRADRSTLLSSAAWPVLIANIIDWQRAELPGLSRVNARPGMPVRLKPDSPVDRVEVTYHSLAGASSNEDARPIDVHNGMAILGSDRPGIYRVSAGEEVHRYTVNALSPEESDLSGAGTAEHGLWNDERALRTDYRGLAWILGLAALGLLAFHAWLQYRPTGTTPAVTPETTT